MLSITTFNFTMRISQLSNYTIFDNNKKFIDLAWAATILRIGMGLVFVIGGYNKLSQLLSSDRSLAIVESYTGTSGYINEFFLNYLFSGSSWLSPWGFLTALSTFELVSGIALCIGLMVRPLALVYAFLLWSFVFSLPVVTTPGVELEIKTYTSPAIFVQIRDIALSGIMFVMLIIGSGRFSLDSRILKNGVTSEHANWDNLGLLLRLSLAAPLLIGGFFANFSYIATFSTFQPILMILGLALLFGVKVREAATLVAAVMLWFMITKLNFDKSLIANLNGFKREFALLAAAIVIALRGSGNAYTPADISRRVRYALGREVSEA